MQVHSGNGKPTVFDGIATRETWLEMLERHLRSIREEIALGTRVDPTLVKHLEDGVAQHRLAPRGSAEARDK